MAKNRAKGAAAREGAADPAAAPLGAFLEQASLEQKMALASEWVDRITFARRHGLGYTDDARDMYKVGGYPRGLTFAHYMDLYLRDPVARVGIDMPAETTWRVEPELSIEDEPEGTEFTEAAADLAERIRLWKVLETADKLARVGRYSVVFIGTRGTGDDSMLKRPQGNLSGPNDILYMTPYSEKNAQIEEWVTDPQDARYGLPLVYRLTTGTLNEFTRQRSEGSTLLVHASRVIHIAEDTLEDAVFGTPALQCVYNDLWDYQKVSTSTGEAYWQQVTGILMANIEGDTELPEGALADLDEVLAELYHDLRRTVMMRGGSLERIAGEIPTPEEASKLYERRISAGLNIPVRMIFGSETGERSSTEDQKSYMGRIADRQTTHAEPNMVRAALDWFIRYRALPRPAANQYDVTWPPLFQEPASEIAAANLHRANAVRALTPPGADPMLAVEIDEDRNIWPLVKGAEDESPFALEEDDFGMTPPIGPPEEEGTEPDEEPDEEEQDG